ncbi:MAG: EipA family protein [Erythrobacter sp.]|jgi:hypothetical protein|nr:EipA family protein [Erythrobacter sp.]
MAAVRRMLVLAAALFALAFTSALMAQELEMVDPDDAFAQPERGQGAIDGDLIGETTPAAPLPEPVPAPSETFSQEYAVYSDDAAGVPSPQWTDPANGATVGAETAAGPTTPASAPAADTYGEDDLIGAAEGVFGRGAEGIARMIEDLLKKEGRPNGYIVGREAGGAFIFGARYGSGTLHHKIEGTRKVYWTGPSLGADVGANAANTFVLVYNLFDTEDLFERFPAGEGQAYLVGGLHASYVRRGDIVLIPIRLGAGLRLGFNAGYLRFSEKQRWLPF